MKTQDTVALAKVKACLRRTNDGHVENQCGWSVFVDTAGRRRFVIDDQTFKPVPFADLSLISRARSLVPHHRHLTSY